jgi:hypothetical protein
MRFEKSSLAIMLLAMLPAECFSAPPVQTMRSVADQRERPSDEHDRPYFRETQSHRGWEIRTPQFTVFADTSVEDARLTAGQIEEAWQAASNLASHWTSAPRNADFGLNALQVVITSEPTRERDAPPTTLNVVGIQTQVQINIAAGQPPLGQQLVRIREGAAFGMLHAAGLDAASPPWLMSGIASFAGRKGLPDEALSQSARSEQLPRLGGQQWRYSRSQADQLAYPPTDHEESASRATFLLTGNDAQHAPALVALLREAQAAAQARAATDDVFAQASGESTQVFDQFFLQRKDDYEVWKANPSSGQPVFEPARDASADVLAAEREMLVLLKLQQRFSGQLVARPSRSAKIIELGKDGRPMIKRTAANIPPASFTSFAAGLLKPGGQPWATLDASGQLLFSSDAERVNELLAPDQVHYDFQGENGNAVLVRRSERGSTIRGWLEQNPQDKSRPIARFEVAAAKGNVRVNEFKRAPQAPGAQVRSASEGFRYE